MNYFHTPHDMVMLFLLKKFLKYVSSESLREMIFWSISIWSGIAVKYTLDDQKTYFTRFVQDSFKILQGNVLFLQMSCKDLAKINKSFKFLAGGWWLIFSIIFYD